MLGIMQSLALLWVMFFGVIQAHMQLTFPLPLESSLDSRNTNPDYSMTSPLNQDGSNFPCKGYLTRPDAHVTATFTAGQNANFTLAGSATHGGGSCQVSLSYDGGVTFKVINTILGGCPLQSTYDFQFPSNLPSGNNVVFSWSWMNKVGNREMYQNCALINVVGTGSQSALSSLPDMQVANVGNGCTSVEGTEVIPLNPGTNVQYGGSYVAGASAVNGLYGAGLTGSCGTVSLNKNNAASTSKGSTTSSNKSSTTTTSKALPTTTTTTTSASAATTPAAAQGTSCTNGAIVCTGSGYTWSLCSAGSAVPMGAVAPGTICKNGAMILDTSSSTSSAAAGNVVKVSATMSTSLPNLKTSSVITTSKTSSTTTSATTSTTQAAVRPGFVIATKAIITTTSTTSAAATTTSNCLSKREARAECEDFSLKCGADVNTYQICARGLWGSSRQLESNEFCRNNEISVLDSNEADTQIALQGAPQCSGTGISCADEGLTYYVCDSSEPNPVPAGMRCVETTIGGGFVSWHVV